MWKLREPGYHNDDENDANLGPLPFATIMAPTLLTHGSADGAVPVDHSKRASEELGNARLIVVDKGHHFLPVCPHFDDIANDRLEFLRSAS